MLMDQYAQHLTREGELKPAERAWQTANDTYGLFQGARYIGIVELTIGFLTLAGLVSPLQAQCAASHMRFPCPPLGACRRHTRLPDVIRDPVVFGDDAGGLGSSVG